MEVKILMTNEQEIDRVFDILAQLVQLDTINDPENKRFVDPITLESVEILFKEIGLVTEVHQSNGFSSLRAFFGTGRPHIVFLGHLDVVPFDQAQWTTDPLKLTRSEENSTIAFGRGAHDDKGALVAMFLAAEKLAPQVSQGTVSLIITTDEEIGGAYGAQYWANHLEKTNQLPDFIINSDGGVDMKLVGSRRGVFAIEVSCPFNETKVNGVPSSLTFKTNLQSPGGLHSAYFRPGSDQHALLAASKFVQKNRYFVKNLRGAFIKGNVIPSQVTLEIIKPMESAEEHIVDLNLTKVISLLGRTSRLYWNEEYPSDYGINITPNILTHSQKGTRIRIDVRTFCTNKKTIKNEFQRCFDEIGGASITVGFGGGNFFTKKDSPLLKTASAVALELGLDPTIIEQEGASDSRYFSPKGVPCIELAPLGGSIHSPNEWVDLESIIRVAKFYEQLTIQLLK